MSDLTEFLLARIAEDEALYRVYAMEEPFRARVLAECDAKRRIIELHPVYRGPRLLAVDSSGTDFACETCHAVSSISEDSVIEALGWCDTLRLLALPYADHESYREDWKP